MTQEITDHEVSRIPDAPKLTLVYPNGGADDVTPIADRRSATPELLFAASYFSPWQGLDLLLGSLGSCNKEFILHLAGEMSPRDAEAAGRDPRVVVHGSLSPQEMRKVAEVCWIGVSSLAIERQGFQTACPLKVRDYLAMGLPAVGNHLEVFPEAFPFYARRAPDACSLLEAAHQWRAVSRSEVATTSHPYISKKLILQAFYDELAQAWSNGEGRH
ncbi:MAG: glycosyltransferase [Actinomycetota bacterium]|nr:glycosyltransferase [Actinomycetota bacterium]